MKRIILIFCCLIMATHPLRAQAADIDDEHRRLAEELLTVMKVGEQMQEQMKQMQSNTSGWIVMIILLKFQAAILLYSHL